MAGELAPDRASVERSLRAEEELLRQVASLLVQAVSFAAWPEGLREILVVALSEDGLPRQEGWKARRLARHLFGPRPPR